MHMGPCIAVFFVIWIVTIYVTKKLTQWDAEVQCRIEWEKNIRRRMRSYVRGIINYVRTHDAPHQRAALQVQVHNYTSHIMAYYRLLEVPTDRDAQILTLACRLETRYAYRRQQ
jgi:hypothetical protein